MLNSRLFPIHILLCTVLLAGQSLAQEKPYINKVQILDFGELLGLPGSCRLDFDTKELSDLGGNLCPFSDQRFGEPLRYLVVADPNSQVEFRVISYLNPAQGLSYAPEGIYEVSGLADVPIIVNQLQTIDAGATGVINIIMGGTLTTSQPQSFNSSFFIEIEDGISFEPVL